MLLNDKTLEELRKIINGDGTPDYRSGSALVTFFNKLGFNDSYGQGFPSRWGYTDEKLQKINGTSDLDKCIRNAFAVIDYVDRISELDVKIELFNRYLAFDKWRVVRNNDEITFKKLDKVVVEEGVKKITNDESDFLKLNFEVDIGSLDLAGNVTEIMNYRLREIESCIDNKMPLASVILIGSLLEGLLLGMALKYPREFNRAKCAPKHINDGKTKKFQEWRLKEFIEVSAEIGLLEEDVKKFSDVLRDFRNYIHPYSQLASGFSPSEHTALICLQVLRAAIFQSNNYVRRVSSS